MATLTAQQIEQKKQLLEEKIKEVNSIIAELKEAGALELKDEELDQVTGGFDLGDEYHDLMEKFPVDEFAGREPHDEDKFLKGK